MNLRQAATVFDAELYLGAHNGALVTIGGRGRSYHWTVSRNSRTLRGCEWPLDVAQAAAIAAVRLMDHLDEVVAALNELNELDERLDLNAVEVKPLTWLNEFKLYHLRNFPHGSEGMRGWVWDGNQWLPLPCPLENRVNGELISVEEPITVADALDALRGVEGRFGLIHDWRGWPLSRELNGEEFWLFPL